MIPACVADVMSEQRILSLEIERMPKDVGVDFGNMYAYPYFSVAASSTHDMSPIRGWWSEESGELRNNYWWHQLCYEGYPPQECPGWLACDVVRRHMRSGSMLAILPLQDWMAIDETLRRADAAAERINVPANPNHYWRYRMHLSLGELVGATGLNEKIQTLITDNGR
jgi:4-alpha-glucanotransferase